jgi:hypothetical protein
VTVVDRKRPGFVHAAVKAVVPPMQVLSAKHVVHSACKFQIRDVFVYRELSGCPELRDSGNIISA